MVDYSKNYGFVEDQTHGDNYFNYGYLGRYDIDKSNSYEFIDYDTQFEKTFLDPLKDILNCVGWDYEKRYTIDNFFV